MLLSTIIVSANTRELLEQCLRSAARATAKLEAELIVVDNASTDGSVDMIRQRFPDIRLIANDANRGFATASNQGLRACQGRFALLLNSDTVVSEDALIGLVTFMLEHPRAGMAGPRLVGKDGATQPSASDLPGLRMQIASFLGLRTLIPRPVARMLIRTPGLGRIVDSLAAGYFTPASSTTSTRQPPQQVGFISGACLLARRETWEQIGLLDEEIFLFLEDADWCRRAREGAWELWYVPEFAIVHLGGKSFEARSGGRTHHISRERCRSLVYYFNKHEPPWKAFVLKRTVLFSLRARLMKLAVGRATRRIDPETYATDADFLRDVMKAVGH